MKLILITIFITFWAVVANAEPIPKPCFRCTGLQKQILEGFEGAEPIDGEAPSTVFSGVCAWEGNGNNPNHEHYGVAFLEIKDGIVYFGGRFIFFAEENPYSDWTPVDARKNMPKLYDDNHRLQHYDDYSYVDLNEGGEHDVKYWFRQSGQVLYLLSKWGRSGRGLCELVSNQVQ